MIEPRELAHSDDALQAALVKALEENAMLRRALDERALAPGTRRWVGRVIAGLIFALGIAVGALFLVYTRARSHRDDVVGMPAPVVAPAPSVIVAPTPAPAPTRAPASAPAAAIAPAAAPAPSAPRQ